MTPTPQSKMRAKTKKFKHVKIIPFKNRGEVNAFLKLKYGDVYSPYLDSNTSALYYGVPDKRSRYGWRRIATYENGKLRY